MKPLEQENLNMPSKKKTHIKLSHTLHTESTPLRKHVRDWIIMEAEGSYAGNIEMVFKDLFPGGCGSGIVGHLVYNDDCKTFFKRYRTEIAQTLNEWVEAYGSIDAAMTATCPLRTDPLCYNIYTIVFATHFVFEHIARDIATRAQIYV
jgi:hypothetical protein